MKEMFSKYQQMNTFSRRPTRYNPQHLQSYKETAESYAEYFDQNQVETQAARAMLPEFLPVLRGCAAS